MQSRGTQSCNIATYLRDICRHVSDWSSRKYDEVVWIGHSFMGACNFPVNMKQPIRSKHSLKMEESKKTYAIKTVLRAANSDWCIPGKTAAT